MFGENEPQCVSLLFFKARSTAQSICMREGERGIIAMDELFMNGCVNCGQTPD